MYDRVNSFVRKYIYIYIYTRSRLSFYEVIKFVYSRTGARVINKRKRKHTRCAVFNAIRHDN